MDHCEENEADELRSKIYSSCIELQKAGNTSPYLLSTIMDLEKEEGLKNNNREKLQSAIEVTINNKHGLSLIQF